MVSTLHLIGKKETCHCLQAKQEDAIYCGHTGCTGKGQRIHRTPDQEMSSVSGEGHEKGSKGLKLASRRSTLESKRLSQSNRGGNTRVCKRARVLLFDILSYTPVLKLVAVNGNVGLSHRECD